MKMVHIKFEYLNSKKQNKVKGLNGKETFICVDTLEVI